MNNKIKSSIVIGTFTILVLLSILIGNIDVSINELLDGNEEHLKVILLSRVPRTMSIVISGVGLSISGLVLQKLFQNRFVSPTTAGTQDGAKLGYVICLVFFTNASVGTKTLFTFVCSMVVTLLFMFATERMKYKNVIYVPIVGIMIGTIISSFATIIAYQTDTLQNIGNYFMGNFATVTKGNYESIYLVIPAVIILYLYASKFNIASMGKEFSINLGLNYRQVVLVGIGLVSITNALIIVTIGSIGFVGLIVPNVIRLIYDDNLKRTLPITAIFGAGLLLLCDIVGRVIISPYEVPIGLSLGVIGSIIFLTLIIREAKNEV